jgi:hypothetical protein
MEETNGTRHFALAAGRADTGDHSVVAVLRPLNTSDPAYCAPDQAPPMAGPFLRRVVIEIRRHARFFCKIPI